MCLLIVGVSFLASPTCAQNQRGTSYSRVEVFPQRQMWNEDQGSRGAPRQVWDGVQGPQGYLWLGSYAEGVARFDSRQFDALTIEDGLPSNLVTTLHVDSAGTIWIGSRGGLARYDETSVESFTQKRTAPSSATAFKMLSRARRKGPCG